MLNDLSAMLFVTYAHWSEVIVVGTIFLCMCTISYDNFAMISQQGLKLWLPDSIHQVRK